MTVLFLPDYSGANPYQSNLASELDEKVTYGCPESRLPVLAAIWTKDISVVHVHWLNLFFNGETWWERTVGVGVLVVRLLVIRLAGLPVVWTVHNARFHDCPHPRLERWFKRWFVTSGACHRLVVHCEAVAEELIEVFDLPRSTRNHIDVIPHGHYIDNYENELDEPAARASLDIDHSETVFLFFGMIRRYKGVIDLIDAFEQASLPDSTLLIAGNPATEQLRAELESKTTGSDRTVGVYEFIPRADIQRYMNAADAVVLPFRRVSTSGSAILAMSFETALIVPKLGCLPALLDEQGAILYEHSDPAGIEQSLEAALERDLAGMGAHNRAVVSAYDWETIADQTQTTYQRARNRTAG